MYIGSPASGAASCCAAGCCAMKTANSSEQQPRKKSCCSTEGALINKNQTLTSGANKKTAQSAERMAHGKASQHPGVGTEGCQKEIATRPAQSSIQNAPFEKEHVKRAALLLCYVPVDKVQARATTERAKDLSFSSTPPTDLVSTFQRLTI